MFDVLERLSWDSSPALEKEKKKKEKKKENDK